MAFTSTQLRHVADLASEVAALAIIIAKENDAYANANNLRHDHAALGSRNTGTLRRRSMDLTRALADLRKP